MFQVLDQGTRQDRHQALESVRSAPDKNVDLYTIQRRTHEHNHAIVRHKRFENIHSIMT